MFHLHSWKIIKNLGIRPGWECDSMAFTFWDVDLHCFIEECIKCNKKRGRISVHGKVTTISKKDLERWLNEKENTKPELIKEKTISLVELSKFDLLDLS